MAQQAFLTSFSLMVSHALRKLQLVFLLAMLAATAGAQTPQQQYVFGDVPTTAATSQLTVYSKNAQTGAIASIPGSPFTDGLQGGPLAVDALGRFLFVINPQTNDISMFQIDQSTGNITHVPDSPFSTGPTENPNMAAKSPACLAVEKSGQFLYVGYRFGNLVGQGAINEYLIDAGHLQLVPLPGQPTTDIASAPIGMVTDPKGLHLYVGLGLNPSTGVQDAGTDVYSIDPVTGSLTPQGSAGNALLAGRSIAIDPKGRFFFDGWGNVLGTIDSALISPADGTALTGVSSISSGELLPAAMLTDSSGKFLYVEQGNTAVVYVIDQTTGALGVPPAAVAVLNFRPNSAAADPLGPYIYSIQPDGVHGLLIDTQSGSLSEIPGSPFGGAAAQGALAISGSPAQAASGPVASLFPASKDFGSITVGQSSGSQLITLTNTGDQGLSLNSIHVNGLNSSDFVATPNCSFPTVLSPNATCTVSVVFSPTAPGTRQASLAATDDAPGSPQSIPLSGTGASPLPSVTLTPGMLTFSSTLQGSTTPAQTVTVNSVGSSALHIFSVLPGGEDPADFQVVNTCSGAYPAGGTCTIAVTFSPLAAGQRTAYITINDDAPGSPQTITLSGTGTAAPPGTAVVKLSRNSVAFGAVTQGTTVASQAITITSSGTGPLHITSVAVAGPNASDFNVANGCTAAAYAVGASCTISVSLSPIAVGPYSASISITDDAPNSPQVIVLSATVNPAFAISPAAPGATAVTVTAGQTADFHLQLTPGPGFTGSASFTCAGAPAAATCTASNVQFASGTSISYVVSVVTTANSLIVLPPMAPQFQRFTLSRGWTLVPWYVLLALFLYVSRLRRRTLNVGFLRIATVAFLASLCVFEIVGCGGGATSASPQAVPTPHAIGTPQGTSTITLTSSVTTATGVPLPGIPPIQLTLTVQ
jgi:6-phosphogluconolactonase (cycloisomerase 2 family)